MNDEEMDAELKEILREAFGDSSSDDESDPSDEWRKPIQFRDTIDGIAKSQSIFGESCCWEPITGINGLWICRDFLSPDQQCSLLSALEKEGYFAEVSHNQAMRFGDLPCWAIELAYNIRENVLFSGCVPESDSVHVDKSEKTCPFPQELLFREPLFNQLIVNIYQPGEGICAHIDLMRFEDGIAIISLESSCVMDFTLVECATSHIEEEMNERCTPLARIPVLLVPGSLVFMWGEARYLWKHQINRKPGFQLWEGKEIEQKRRTSVTLRRLCRTG